MIKVAIIGAESTGKTVLSQSLAQHYNACLVPEYARQYLTNLDREYDQADLLDIAKGQVNAINECVLAYKEILFSDTDLNVIKVWSEYKYGNCDPWILHQIELQNFDFYLLTDFDIPYEEDPLRENPDDRGYFFNVYQNLLKEKGLPFAVISGSKDHRLQLAIKHINPLF